MLMHLAPLVALLLAPAPAQEQRPSSLADALPDSAALALHVPAAQTLIAKRETSSGVALVLDPDFRRALGGFFAVLQEADGGDLDRAVIQSTLEDCYGVLSASDELVAYAAVVRGDMGIPEASFVTVGRGDAALGAAIASIVGEDAVEADVAGATSGRWDGSSKLHAVAGGVHVLVIGESLEACVRAAEAQLAATASGAASGPFVAEGMARHRRSDDDLAACIDLAMIWSSIERGSDLTYDAKEGVVHHDPDRIGPGGDPDDENPALAWMLEGARSVGWVHMGVRFGEGNDWDTRVAMPFAPDSFVDGLLAHLAPIDRSALADVPRDAISMTAFSLDLAGLLRWVETDVSERDEAIGEGLAQGLDLAQQILGVDLRTALVSNLAPTIVQWDRIDDTEGTLMPIPTTYIVRVEDCDPLLDMMDVVEGLLAANFEVTTASHAPGSSGSGYDIWSVDVVAAVYSIAIGEGRIVVTDAERAGPVLDALHAAPDGDRGRFIDRPSVASALDGAAGARGLMSVDRAEAAADALRALGEFVTEVGMAFEDETWDERARADIVTLADLMDRYLEGLTVTTMEVREDRLLFLWRSL